MAIESKPELRQLELFGLGRLMQHIASLRPDALRRLFRGLLFEAAWNPGCVTAIEETGEVLMEASMETVAAHAGCSSRSIQRYSRKLQDLGLVIQDQPVNEPAVWTFQLSDVLPSEAITWYRHVIETGDPHHECDVGGCDLSPRQRGDCHPDSSKLSPRQRGDSETCHPTCHPDSGVTATPETPKNAGNSSGCAPYELSYVMQTITSEHKEPSLPEADLDLLRSSFEAARSSGVQTLGTKLQRLQSERSIDIGMRSFAAIDFDDVLRIAGRSVNGEHWPLLQRRKIFAAYFADAVKATVADRSEIELFAAVFLLAARLKPKPPADGADSRAGYLRAIWDRRCWRVPSCSDEDKRRAAELIGSVVPA